MSVRRGRVLSLSKLPKRILNAEYAVRGKLAIEGEKLKEELFNNPNSMLPFKHILSCNLGNPQALNQPPISFYRKIISLMESFYVFGGPDNEKKIVDLFGIEVYERVIYYYSNLKSSIGAYSHSQGHPFIRSLVASFIDKRDGLLKEEYASNAFVKSTIETDTLVANNTAITSLKNTATIDNFSQTSIIPPPCNLNHIFLTNGASSAIHFILSAIIENLSVGILIPEPQYSLYSATITLCQGVPVFYPLIEPVDRFGKWTFSIEALRTTLISARKKNIDVRALCIISPGNPTGNVLSSHELENIIFFCWEENLVLLADEVYQSNVWDKDVVFCSARKALYLASAHKNPALLNEVEIFSFHSISKGYLGECGKRGGYVECTNIDPDVLDQLYKLVSISLCSNIEGQLMIGLLADPPSPNRKDGSLSREYSQYVGEITAIRVRRAQKLSEALNRMEGVICARPQGALYLFPRFTFSNRFIDEAQRLNTEPDTLYGLKLLKATGICTVNGSGFGQTPGTFHLRFTFLPQENLFQEFTLSLEHFHLQFCKEYPLDQA